MPSPPNASPRPADITAIRIGDTASCEVTIGAEQIAAFAALSGDVNPLHLDGDFAAVCGFERAVAHGMLALAAISRLIGTELPGPGSLWAAQDVKFPSPVLDGDVISAQVVVEQVSLATGLVLLRTEAVNLTTGALVLSGRARVRVAPYAAGEARP
jgi:acyl dehydratase